MLRMNRFQGTNSNLKSHDVNLHEGFDDLRSARNAMDSEVSNFFESLSEEQITSDFTFQTFVNPETITQSMAPALANIFNHQTHHRGQVHHLLSQLTGEAPPLDLIYYQSEQMHK